MKSGAFLHPKSTLFAEAKLLKARVAAGLFYPGKKPHHFVFLCGANRSPGNISARRLALSTFLRKNFPEANVIIAEVFFNFFQKDNNLYDLENLLSRFSDLIVVVLESESAFAELGAFVSPALRPKVFAINNIEFKGHESFINLGPLAALRESDKDSIAWYQMAKDGVSNCDSIADTFESLSRAIEKRKPSTDDFSVLALTAEGEANRWGFSFCHDLIFLSRGIKKPDLLSLYKVLFGDRNFGSLKIYIALLQALEFVREDRGILSSTRSSMILESIGEHLRFRAASISHGFRQRTK